MFDDAADIGLGEAVYRIVDVLRDSPAAGGAVTDHWTRMVSTIAKHDSLPFSDVKVVEQVIADACRGWSDEQRRSLYEQIPDCMGDAERDEPDSFPTAGWIAFALPEALLDEVMQVAWYEATLLKKQQAKARRRRKK